MNIEQLEKIIKQIEKYQLWDEIKDVEKWFESLTNKEINNFIKLNVKVTKSIIKYKHLLISLLDSDYYLHDIKLISNARTDYIAQCLSTVARDGASLESPHHENDMELIANSKSDEEAKEKLSNIINRLKNKENNSNKNKLTNDEKIDIIYENAIKYVDGDKTKELPPEVFKIKNN